MEKQKQKNDEKTSIRDIEVSEKREHIDSYSHEFPPQSTSSYKNKNKKKKRWPRLALLGLIIIVVFALLSAWLHAAKVEVTPKYEEISFAGESAYQATAAIDRDEESAPNVIEYQLADFSFSASKEIDSIGVEENDVQATGKIRIINDSNETQKLLKETRFRNGDQIFMTYKSTTVPANSSIVAEAFATEPGPEYNVPVGTKFDIPGFEEANSPLFDQMRGEVEEAFQGGMVGKNNIPNKNDLETARENLETELSLRADTEVMGQLEDGYLLVDSESFREFSETMTSKGNKVVLEMTIKVTGVLFKESDFIQMIFNLDDQDEELKIKDVSALSFDVLSKNLSVAAADDFDFNLHGEIEIYRQFDEEVFLALVKGNSKKEAAEKIKTNFENFDIDISVRPFWRSALPKNKEDIKIKIKQ